MQVDTSGANYRLEPTELDHPMGNVATRFTKKRKIDFTVIDLKVHLRFYECKIKDDFLIFKTNTGPHHQFYAISLKEKALVPVTGKMHFTKDISPKDNSKALFKQQNALAKWVGTKSNPKTGFAENGNTFFIGYKKGVIKGISKETFEQISSFKTAEAFTPKVICLHNNLMIVGYRKTSLYPQDDEFRLIIWDINSGKQLRTLIDQERGTVKFITVHEDQIICQVEEKSYKDVTGSKWIGGYDVVRNDKVLLFDAE